MNHPRDDARVVTPRGGAALGQGRPEPHGGRLRVERRRRGRRGRREQILDVGRVLEFKQLALVDRVLEGTRAALIHEGERPRVAQVVEVVERLGRLLPRVGAGSALREAVRTLRLEEILSSLPRGRSKVLNVRKFLSMADEADDPRALVARVRS